MRGNRKTPSLLSAPGGSEFWDFKDFCNGRNHGIHGNALRAARKDVSERQPSDFSTEVVSLVFHGAVNQKRLSAQRTTFVSRFPCRRRRFRVFRGNIFHGIFRRATIFLLGAFLATAIRRRMRGSYTNSRELYKKWRDNYGILAPQFSRNQGSCTRRRMMDSLKIARTRLFRGGTGYA